MLYLHHINYRPVDSKYLNSEKVARVLRREPSRYFPTSGSEVDQYGEELDVESDSDYGDHDDKITIKCWERELIDANCSIWVNSEVE